MEITEKVEQDFTVTLRQLIENNPASLAYILDALELLMHQNAALKRIASKYSHDLRSPVTNIHMLLQLFEKTDSDEDRTLYLKKMRGSVERLQDGFEHLSEERKNSLKKESHITTISIDATVNKVNRVLPETTHLEADFSEGMEALGIAYNLEAALYFLCTGLNEEQDKILTISITTQKAWEGMVMCISYPDFMGLAGHDLDMPGKNLNRKAGILQWNYYFASLFLGAMGANISIEESEQSNTQLFISFTNQQELAG